MFRKIEICVRWDQYFVECKEKLELECRDKFFSKSIYGEDIIDTIIWIKFEGKK